MIAFLMILALLTILFWVAYHVTGALLSAAIWLLVKLPFAMLMFLIGLALCVTILFIPLGAKCIRCAFEVIT